MLGVLGRDYWKQSCKRVSWPPPLRIVDRQKTSHTNSDRAVVRSDMKRSMSTRINPRTHFKNLAKTLGERRSDFLAEQFQRAIQFVFG
jgi:hypothetical protein